MRSLRKRDWHNQEGGSFRARAPLLRRPKRPLQARPFPAWRRAARLRPAQPCRVARARQEAPPQLIRWLRPMCPVPACRRRPAIRFVQATPRPTRLRRTADSLLPPIRRRATRSLHAARFRAPCPTPTCRRACRAAHFPTHCLGADCRRIDCRPPHRQPTSCLRRRLRPRISGDCRRPFIGTSWRRSFSPWRTARRTICWKRA